MEINHPKPIVLLGLLLCEALVLSFSYDIQPLSTMDGLWFTMLSSAGVVLKFLSAMLVALFIGLGPRLLTYRKLLATDYAEFYWLPLTLHLFFFLALMAVSELLLGKPLEPDTSNWLPISWFAITIATIALWILSLARISFWQTFAVQESFTLLLTIALGIFTLTIALTANQLWEPLSNATFAASAFLLGLIYPEIIVEPAAYILGTPDFLVSVDEACSGYEGIGLVLAFTVFYLSVFRKEFRFPQALILIPLGVSAIWLTNTFRIALLISLGHEVSPELAIGGFHSLAGWIFFVFVTTALLLTSHRWAWVRHGDVLSSSELTNSTTALLIPVIILLAFTLLTSAVTTDFVWTYPLRVIAVGGILYYLWHFYELTLRRPLTLPIAAGVAVFIIWVLLVKPDAESDQTFSQSLAGIPATYAALWLLFRVTGSVITVPIAEELAFRGYLLAKLSGHDPVSCKPLNFSWFGMGASSLAFGLLHDAWLAGILAGLCYGWVRYQRDNLTDAIIAHSITNFLLFLYASVTGHWSIW